VIAARFAADLRRRFLGRPTFRLAVLCATLVALAAFAAPAFASEQHTFDPLLSLTGKCTVSPLDEVPDSGPCPGEPGVDHPPKPFSYTCGTATDRHGDIYVSSPSIETPTKGRIDVFNPQGEYLTEIKDPNRPCSIAVDSEGNLYVTEGFPNYLVLFKPKSFPLAKGAEYEPPLIVREEGETSTKSVAVDPSDDHVFSSVVCCGQDTIYEYGSAAEGNPLLVERDSNGSAEEIGSSAVWGKNHDIYASGVSSSALGAGLGESQYARAFIFDGTDGHLKCEIDGSEVPGGFGFGFGNAGVAVDQSNGDLYLSDVAQREVVDQFDSECHFIGQIEHSFTPTPTGPFGGAGLALDAPYEGEPGYDSPNQGELYVAQGVDAEHFHLFAFSPRPPLEPPEVEAQRATSITETETLLRARVNPGAADTTYRFQYISQADYEADGETYGEGTQSAPAPEADAGSGASFKAVSAPISGLAPKSAYRFRLVATNHCKEAEPEVPCTTSGAGKAGEEGADAAFTTYGPDPGMPDQRGYELVSPPDTNGLIPTAGIGRNAFGISFTTALVSPDGQSVSFGTEGGSLPDLEGGGFHDLYTATRTPTGWQTSFAGLTGAEAPREVFPGGVSPDHRYSFWGLGDSAGTLAEGNYLRGPQGVEPIPGPGGDLTAEGLWIGPGGHQILYTTGAIYQRSAGGPPEALSILPGESTPTGGTFAGISADGSAVVFESGKDLYVRLFGAETQLVAEGGAPFAAISSRGTHVAYMRLNPTQPRRPNPVITTQPTPGPPQGELFTYDTATEQETALGAGDKAVLVNVSPDGSHIYFLSPEQLDGAQGTPGAENLYVWDAATETIGFIATVTQRDVYGTAEGIDAVGTVTDGLGLWTDYAARGQGSSYAGPGSDPSRSSADGSVLIFESRARLSAYQNAGHAEIYRYEAGAETLACLSCTPTGAAPTSDASLQSIPPLFLHSLPPVNDMAEVINLSPDGARAFFQSAEPLVLGDTDELQDVYEWEAPGKGTCTESSSAFQPQAGGCIYLISGPRSASDDYLYGMTPHGSDAVFLSGDLLSFEDHDKTPSLYDARIGGGFPEPPPIAGECLGEACQPAAVVPDKPSIGTSGPPKAGNVIEAVPDSCPKGKVKKHGKCLKPHKKAHKKHHREAHAHRRAHR
jgi:hypothetical protein